MKAFKLFYLFLSFIILVYVALPGPDFPQPLGDSLQSDEPGDTEDPLRRAYFTDYSREEIMSHYKEQFRNKYVFGIVFPTLQLNYPPEDAKTIIKEQTRSVFLEELLHPFRESFFINGFRSQRDHDIILINDKVWLHKVTVKYVPSSLPARMTVTTITLVLGWFVMENWRRSFKKVFK